MYDNDEIELTAEERILLSALPRELQAGDLLEERVVRVLRKDGHFGDSRASRRFSNVWKIAAAIALFAGGVATGRFLMTPDAPQSASVAAPAPATIRATDTTRPAGESFPVNGETVVAVRELWL